MVPVISGCAFIDGILSKTTSFLGHLGPDFMVTTMHCFLNDWINTLCHGYILLSLLCYTSSFKFQQVGWTYSLSLRLQSGPVVELPVAFSDWVRNAEWLRRPQNSGQRPHRGEVLRGVHFCCWWCWGRGRGCVPPQKRFLTFSIRCGAFLCIFEPIQPLKIALQFSIHL